jgi:autotransporter-associated beta strand protein
VDYGLVHVGKLVSGGTTIRTSGGNDTRTAIQLANGDDGIVVWSVSGGGNPVFNAGTVEDNRTLAGSLPTAGIFTSATVLSLTPGTESGSVLGTETPVPVAFKYSAQVFSGNATWSGVDGTWGAEGTDAGGWLDDNPTVPVIRAAPGTFSGFDSEDQATFSGDGGIVSLNSVSPSVKTLIFGGANGYTLAQGTGGTLFLKGTSASITTSGSAAHQIGAPVNLVSDVAVTAATDLTLAGAVSGARALSKAGAGTLTLGVGTHTYEGATTVSEGTLAVEGTLDDRATAVTVSATGSAALTGTGNIARPVVVGANGRLEPTGATGTLTVKSLTMVSGATFAVAVSGATCGQLAVSSGAVSLGNGVATLSLSGTASGIPLTLVTGASGVSGYFKDGSGTLLKEGTLVTFDGRTFRISYTGGKVMLGGAAEGTLFLIR